MWKSPHHTQKCLTVSTSMYLSVEINQLSMLRSHSGTETTGAYAWPFRRCYWVVWDICAFCLFVCLCLFWKHAQADDVTVYRTQVSLDEWLYNGMTLKNDINIKVDRHITLTFYSTGFEIFLIIWNKCYCKIGYLMPWLKLMAWVNG